MLFLIRWGWQIHFASWDPSGSGRSLAELQPGNARVHYGTTRNMQACGSGSGISVESENFGYRFSFGLNIYTFIHAKHLLKIELFPEVESESMVCSRRPPDPRNLRPDPQPCAVVTTLQFICGKGSEKQDPKGLNTCKSGRDSDTWRSIY